MNHLPAHGRLTAEIQAKALELMRKGYFGDGEYGNGPQIESERRLTLELQGFGL